MSGLSSPEPVVRRSPAHHCSDDGSKGAPRHAMPRMRRAADQADIGYSQRAGETLRLVTDSLPKKMSFPISLHLAASMRTPCPRALFVDFAGSDPSL